MSLNTSTPPHTPPAANTSPTLNFYAKQFRKNWQTASADSDITLYGLRRFKTSHLLNLRFLEDEIAEIDHTIYQAGLTLGLDHAPRNKLGLNYAKRDTNAPTIESAITEDLVLRLRSLLSQYDEALSAFSNLMHMERCSLLDDEKAASARADLTLPEMYETRLLRPDLPPRSRADPVSHWMHRLLRDLRYWKLSRRCGSGGGGGVEAGAGAQGIGIGRADSSTGSLATSRQNSASIANVLGRLISTLVTCGFLVVPLATLSPDSPSTAQLVGVSVCVLVFSFLVATLMRATNSEMMAVSAAYAAVLAVFVSK